jgi:hypothetical protein
MKKLTKDQVWRGNVFTRQARDGFVWKKIKDFDGKVYICKMLLRKGTLVYIGSRYLGEQKCRAPHLLVWDIERFGMDDSGKKVHTVDHQGMARKATPTQYTVGKVVKPKAFSRDKESCAPGIHFFLTREEAERY